VVERVLQILMAISSALATVLLGFSLRNPTLPILACLSAVASVVFTDRMQWFRLDRRIAYFAMVMAAGMSLRGFWQNNSEEQLVAIANMLVFIQIVLLFLEKTSRIYSHLAVFSVLQVVVAALLNVGFEFGVLLLAYLLVSFFAMSLFFVHREATRGQSAPAATSTEEQPEWRRALGGEPSLQFRRDPTILARELVENAFIRQISAFGAITVLFAVFFFYFSPRAAGSAWAGRGKRQAEVGFTSEVTLNEIANVIVSNQSIMRVSFSDYRLDAPYKVYGDPYFRGAVMDSYNPDFRGSPQWRYSTSKTGYRLATIPAGKNELVIQSITLEPTNRDALFAVMPAFRARTTESWVREDVRQGVLTRTSRERSAHPIRYEVVTDAFRTGSQLSLTPYRTYGQAGEQLEVSNRERTELTRFDEGRFPEIKKVADELMMTRGKEESQIFRARLLSNYLRSDRFTYTVQLADVAAQRTSGVDPIEDFFANIRSGHCEYFASALVMMLRSQNIPARLVVGFKGGDFNSVGGYFTVRSRHAHAWVEAYIDPAEIPSDSRASIGPGRGAWLRLDPTPGQTADEFRRGGIMGAIDQVLDYSQMIWNDYVMGLNRDRQRAVLSNVADRIGGGGRRRGAQERWSEWLSRFAGSVRRYALRIGGAALLAVAAAAVVYRLRASTRRRPGELARSGERPPIPFYERFERLMAKRGLRRQPQATQLEFADEVIASLGPTSELAAAVAMIVDAFYRVRFGGRALDKEEGSQIERALQTLREA
jgi:transglutaminase-like putative cysteine protease